MGCAEGLRETRHPYATIARLAFSDLAELGTDDSLSEEALRRLMAALRLALLAEPPAAGLSKCNTQGDGGARRSGSIVEAALKALVQVARIEGVRLVPHLHVVLPPIGKHLNSKAHSQSIRVAVQDLEAYG